MNHEKQESNKKDNLHAGHRKRMRKRFHETGLAGFAEHEVLEMLLYYANSQKNTNPLAHQLIREFGSLKGVLDASYEELLEVEGVGEVAATMFKLLPQVFKLYSTTGERNLSLKRFDDRCAFFYEHLKVEKKQEVLLLACLDERLRLRHVYEVARGVPDHVNIDPQKLMKTVLMTGCTRFMLAHNHPMGLPLASYEDVRTTDTIRRLMNEVQMHLVDHIIVADGRSVSMAETGCYNYE